MDLQIDPSQTPPAQYPLNPDKPAMDPPQLKSGDFISTYEAYADVLEVPRKVHTAVSISMLGAALNPRVQIQHGALSLTLDSWTLVLSESGVGRNTLVSLAYPILEQAGLNELVRTNTWGSGPAFYQDIAEHSTGLFIWPEMSQVLKTLNQPQFNGAKEWLTDRYDNTRIPAEVRYRVTGNQGQTPSITFQEVPRLNILATSSFDWFIPNLAKEDTTGGFLPRWCLVWVKSSGKVIPKPQEPDKRLIGPLAEHLKRASELKGLADLSEVESMYDGWYRQAHDRFEQQPNKALAMPFFHRIRAHTLKMAVVFEVSASCTLKVSPEAMRRAIEYAAEMEKTIFQLIPTGMTREGFAVDKIAQKIKGAGVGGVTRSDITRAFQDVKASELTERIRTLVLAGTARAYFRQHTGGRPAYILVHQDFCEQHEQQFPDDKPSNKF